MFPASSPARHSETVGQSMLRIAVEPSIFWAFHVDDPPVGLADVTVLPELSTATHRAGLTHETALTADVPSMSLDCQADDPPTGLFVVNTTGLSKPIPTQNDALRQSASTGVVVLCQVADVPSAGSVEYTSRPSESDAAQNAVDGHVSDSNPIETFTFVIRQVEAPPTGSAEVSTLPASSTAAQNEVVGQAMPVMLAVPSTAVAFQTADVPAAGLVDTVICPFPEAAHR